MKKIISFFTTLKRKREAKREGVPFRKKMWYNYRAMIGEDGAKNHPHIEIFDENGKYIDTKYIVTGINRLTGVREQMSVPYPKAKAENNCASLIAMRASKRAYIYPRVEAYQKELFRMR